MACEKISYGGWQNCLRLSNRDVELVITTDVGPRIISYRHLGGENGRNVFKEFREQSGKRGEAKWQIRGGHRFWVAPEDITTTYAIDNEEVPHSIHDPQTVVLTTSGTPDFPLRKELVITLSSQGSRVRVDHKLTNDGDTPFDAAAWALSVMDAGTIEIIPQPTMGEHPLDLLPNRRLVIWPFTNLDDPRLTMGEKFIVLRHAEGTKALKFGLRHSVGWVASLLGNMLFIKSVPHSQGIEYPDDGCNFETFTNSEILEIETLGEYSTLDPGEATLLTENWWLYETDSPLPKTDDSLREWIKPFVEKSGLFLP